MCLLFSSFCLQLDACLHTQEASVAISASTAFAYAVPRLAS